MTRIGYFVPEFPGQTHMFFWREVQALRRQGIVPDLVSTRPPPARIISHSWADEAIARTDYLAPVTLPGLARAAAELARAMPAGWARCARSLFRARGVGLAGTVRLLGLVAMGGQLAGLARARGWTHIHAHSCADSAHIALFASLLSGVPYSMTLHGPLDDYGPNQREKWRHAAFALIITRQLAGDIRATLAGFLPSRIELAPMGVELHRFNRAAPYASWSGTGRLNIFSCARLNPGKGHVDLIDAVAHLRTRGIDARLVIAGEDEAGGTGYRRLLEAKIGGMADGVVTLLGAVSEDRVFNELGHAHLFALASLQEPLGVAIMEAMAMCVPVVVTGAGGVPELVDDGVDGILVPPSRPDLLARELEALARDPARAARIGAAGRTKVEMRFGSDRSAKVLARLVRQPALG